MAPPLASDVNLKRKCIILKEILCDCVLMLLVNKKARKAQRCLCYKSKLQHTINEQRSIVSLLLILLSTTYFDLIAPTYTSYCFDCDTSIFLFVPSYPILSYPNNLSYLLCLFLSNPYLLDNLMFTRQLSLICQQCISQKPMSLYTALMQHQFSFGFQDPVCATSNKPHL